TRATTRSPEGRIAPLRDRSATTPGPSPRPRHLKARFDSPRNPDKAGGRIREPHHPHHLRPSVAHVRPTPGALRLPGLQHVARTRPKAASRPCVTEVRRRLGRRHGPATLKPDSPRSPDKAGGRIRGRLHTHEDLRSYPPVQSDGNFCSEWRRAGPRHRPDVATARCAPPTPGYPADCAWASRIRTSWFCRVATLERSSSFSRSSWVMRRCRARTSVADSAPSPVSPPSALAPSPADSVRGR